MDSSPEHLTNLGTAYAELRTAIEDLVAKLGGDNFARTVVTVGAREAFGQVMTPLWRLGYKTHMSFCEPLMATPAQMRAATQRLVSTFTVRDIPESFSGQLGRGRLVVRDKRMYFETADAAAQFAHCYEPSGSDARWSTAITSEAEAWLGEHGLPKPSVSLVHTKSQEAAIKGLVRIASQHFKVTLQEVLPAAA